MANIVRDNWQKLTGRAVLAISSTLVLLYLILAPLNLPLYELMLFPLVDVRTPDRTKEIAKIESTYHVVKRDASFRSANGKLIRAWFFEKPDTKRVFLFSHGRGENIYAKLKSAQLLLQCDASVLMYDYEGFGKSEGRIGILKACDDAVAAYDFLVKSEHRDGEDIIAFGESFGSGVSARLSEKRKLGGIILQSGFSSLMRAGRDQIFWLNAYPDWVFPDDLKLDNALVFSKPHPPLLIVHGTGDKLVYFKNAEDIFRKAIEPKKLMTIKNGPHCCFGNSDDFLCSVTSFLKDYKI